MQNTTVEHKMRDILFMGRILASATHEMQNIMAIIKESGALAEDVLDLNPVARMKHGSKLMPALGNIREQVERGRGLLTRLNNFAHAAEDFAASCDLARFAEYITTLSERMAAMRECSLSFATGQGPLMVRGNALLVMHSLHMGILDMLDVCPKNTVITISVRASSASLTCPQAFDKCLPRPALSELMAELDGQIAETPNGITLNFQKFVS